MNDQYFINVASAGFGAEVTATTPQDMKKFLGGMAYSIMGFVKAFQLEPYEGRLILPPTSNSGAVRKLCLWSGESLPRGNKLISAQQLDLTADKEIW